jgi:nucleoside-diphosphate-sugar epimerase
MSRVAVIGGTGHIGTYLIPRLVEAGHDVVVVSRNERQPYQAHSAWNRVEMVRIDRTAAEEAGTFGRHIRALEAEIVMDLICFTEESVQHLVDALRGQVQHFLHCGTIGVYGPSEVVPTTEMQARRPPNWADGYGVKKAQIEAYLLDEARRNAFPATVLHPGHICGIGWLPVTPACNFNPDVYRRLARGEEVLLPNLGMETLHHVHADDVAQSFVQALVCWSASVGEAFNVVSPAAVTMRGLAERVASWFGREAVLRFLPWEEWLAQQSDEDVSWAPIVQQSPNFSIDKARRLIGYRPRYTSYETVYESLMWLVETGAVRVD